MASVRVLLLTVANEIGPRGVVRESLNGGFDVTSTVRGGCRFLPSGSIERGAKIINDGR